MKQAQELRHDELNQITQVLNGSSTELDKLKGFKQSLEMRGDELHKRLSGSQEYLSRKAEIEHHLGELVALAGAKGKKAYEELLTALLREIMPGNTESDSVVFDVGMKRGRPYLNIKVKTLDGLLRDVHLDKGGSVESILAVGLRFICLSRTKSRRILLFDEADIGLNEKHVPKFVKVISDLSAMTGTQVLYISHHPKSHFHGLGRIHTLAREGNKISISYEDAESNTQLLDPIDDYLEYVALENVRQHASTLLSLSPTMNFIVGDCDIGKSTVLASIDAVANNAGRTGLIRDGEKALAIRLGLSSGKEIDYSYRRSGSKKTDYKVTDAEGQLLETSGSGSAIPTFLDRYLNMPLHKGMNLHVNDRYTHAFVFAKQVTEHQRAEILNLGEEDDSIAAMVAAHQERVKQCRRIELETKKELLSVRSELSKFDSLDGYYEEIGVMKGSVDSYKDQLAMVSNLKRSLVSIESVNSTVHVLEGVSELNNLKELARPHELLPSIEQLQKSIDADQTIDDLMLLHHEFAAKPEPNLDIDIFRLARGLERIEREIGDISGILTLATPDIEEKKTEGIEGYLVQHKLLDRDVQSIENMIDYASTVNQLDLKKVRQYGVFSSALQRLPNEVSKSDAVLSDLLLRKTHESEMFNRKLKEAGTCPVCKQVMKNAGAVNV
ncbi:hypothetical protein AB4254_11360 [Vibrio breoganii]